MVMSIYNFLDFHGQKRLDKWLMAADGSGID